MKSCLGGCERKYYFFCFPFLLFVLLPHHTSMATKRVKTRLADAGPLPPVPPPLPAERAEAPPTAGSPPSKRQWPTCRASRAGYSSPTVLGGGRAEGPAEAADGSTTRRKLENSLVFGTVEAVFSMAEYFVLVLLCPTIAGLVLSVLDTPPTYPRVLRSVSLPSPLLFSSSR